MSLNRKGVAFVVLAVLAVASVSWAATALANPAFPRPFRGAGPRGLRTGEPGAGLNDVAEILGMTTDELLTAKAGGKTLAEIAAEKGIARDVLVERIVSLRKAKIDAMVEEGRISREQAEVLLQQVESRIEAMIDAACPARRADGLCPGGQRATGERPETNGAGGGRFFQGFKARATRRPCIQGDLRDDPVAGQ